MSDALSYLARVRPEAAGHYFAFLKDCGKHLDPKTRNLISVITKVDAQTERGLRQYLKRALREGCTPPEVLDALLMAFPTLGLTKILWAIDIILTMDLPGFAPAAMAALAPAAAADDASDDDAVDATSVAPAWHDVMGSDGVARDSVQRVDCDGRGLFVYRGEDDEWRVYDSLCPHQATNIPQLALDGRTLTCPKHQWAFDVRSGDCLVNGDRPLRRWPSQVVNGRLMAQW